MIVIITIIVLQHFFQRCMIKANYFPISFSLFQMRMHQHVYIYCEPT